jgi:hypothetical protein
VRCGGVLQSRECDAEEALAGRGPPPPVDCTNYASSLAVEQQADVLDDIANTLGELGIEVRRSAVLRADPDGVYNLRVAMSGAVRASMEGVVVTGGGFSCWGAAGGANARRVGSGAIRGGHGACSCHACYGQLVAHSRGHSRGVPQARSDHPCETSGCFFASFVNLRYVRSRTDLHMVLQKEH